MNTCKIYLKYFIIQLIYKCRGSLSFYKNVRIEKEYKSVSLYLTKKKTIDIYYYKIPFRIWINSSGKPRQINSMSSGVVLFCKLLLIFLVWYFWKKIV